MNKAEKETVGVYKIVDCEKGFYEEMGTKELDYSYGNEGNKDEEPSGGTG